MFNIEANAQSQIFKLQVSRARLFETEIRILLL